YISPAGNNETNMYFAAYAMTTGNISYKTRIGFGRGPSLFARYHTSSLKKINLIDYADYANKDFMKIIDASLATAKRKYESLQRVEDQIKKNHQFTGKFFPSEISFALNSGIIPHMGPLTYWLLQRERESVGAEELFDKAVEIHRDAWVALAVIYAIMHMDIRGKNRNTHSVLISKIKQDIFDRSKIIDPHGAIYHFWGYLFHTLVGSNNQIILRMLSVGYEVYVTWMRHNRQDWNDVYADNLGIKVGRALKKSVKNPERCEQSAE
ncbi:MAG: hypothetical protein OXB84_08065, partial [Halobacteriovoraceae bacterium]|nr:hypothetical protein [Halobacteriovoraceae bacterium]